MIKPDTKLSTELDRCVMCGLCLPHCPTYQQTQNEAESPRGRISLIKALHQHKLPLDDTLENHLNNCLTCRACEAACPSGVNYAYLIDQSKHLIQEQRPPATPKLVRFALDQLLKPRSHLKRLSMLLWLYQKSGIRKLCQIFGLFRGSTSLKRLDGYLPSPQRPARWKTYYAPISSHKKDVALFLGCASENIDPDTLRASIKLLTQLGYGVHIPKTQGCCGALHQHRGEQTPASMLMQNNIAAFSNCDDIISIATGCTSMLSEYPQYTDTPAAWRVSDLFAFLIEEDALAGVTFKPLAQRIAVHTPCSQRNSLKLKGITQQLLQHIPQLELHDLSSNHICCGAAGSYMLSHPDMADTLREKKLDDIQTIAPDCIVSTNIGCALHISAGLREQKKSISVIHPVALLNQQVIGP